MFHLTLRVAWHDSGGNGCVYRTRDAYKPEIRTAMTAATIGTYALRPREEDPGSNKPGVLTTNS